MTNREKAKRDIGLARKKINEAEAWLDADSLDLMNAMTALVYAENMLGRVREELARVSREALERALGPAEGEIRVT